MAAHMCVKIFLLGLFYLSCTFTYAGKTGDLSGTAATNNNTLSLTTDAVQTEIANQNKIKEVNNSNIENTGNSTVIKDVIESIDKQSDEIIISGLDNVHSEGPMSTTTDQPNSTTKSKKETTTSVVQTTTKNDSLINVQTSGDETTSKKISTKSQKIDGYLPVRHTSTTSTTAENMINSHSSNVSNHHYNVNISNITHHVEMRKHYKHHENIYNPHHIPFRHHLQLVPMDDEPFGSVLLKDQRYIVSVLIPIGVGIVGALVIMVTVYGLRHVAQKHGREFPRVDIEAGRQNIASISSERTDKMLLLDDDEDNEI